MKKEQFYEIIGEIDEKAVKNAETPPQREKKILLKIVSAAASVTLIVGIGTILINQNFFSGIFGNKRTGQIPEISVEEMIGSLEEIPYEEAMKKSSFKMSFDNFTSPNNPLQIKGGTHEDAVVVKPFKSVIVDGSEVVAPLNEWFFPVVYDGSYMGIMCFDMRYPEFGEADFYGGAMYADALNDALVKGSIAVFTTPKGTYGIYEDNTIINIQATEDYQGTLSFKDANKEYNLITPESVNEIVYEKSGS